MVQLDAMATQALTEYNVQVAAGGEPAFPAWIADVRAAIAMAERLEDDLMDARKGLAAATEELRQADVLRGQLVAALKAASEDMWQVGSHDHMVDYGAHSKASKIVDAALAAAGAA